LYNCYFVLLTGLTVGDGETAGLAAGLGLVAVAAASPAGEAVVVGDVALAGEFVLVAGSQAAANAMTRLVVSRSMARLISFNF
jgi:hypothetical protein